ncbi:MAG: RNA polymerase factor sigma-54 [Campylobacterales bacterium]
MQSLQHRQKQQTKLSLKTYLPILELSSSELDDYLAKLKESNPYIDIAKKRNFRSHESNLDTLESSESLFEHLEKQIVPPLFPTPKSQQIALEIIKNITLEGYFDGSIQEIAQKLKVDSNDIEKIRLRFANLQPLGVGALDLKESLCFQIDDLELDEEVAKLCKEIVNDMENSHKYFKHEGYIVAKATISKLNNPPAISFLEDHRPKIADVFVRVEEGRLRVEELSRSEAVFVDQDTSSNSKKSEAKKLIELLKLRNSTILSISKQIAKKQMNFFKGGVLSPLTMQEIADELNLNQSTISRAIKGKYIESSRGIFEIKHFFASVAKSQISTQEIKEFIKSLIESEGDSALSDDELTLLTNKSLKTNISRRAISKYRLALNIPNKKERQKRKNYIS